jgi:hypothetical protein
MYVIMNKASGRTASFANLYEIRKTIAILAKLDNIDSIGQA